LSVSPQRKLLYHVKARTFSLKEILSVLAVIAILAALQIPNVFSAINDARINGTSISTDTIKTATADHYGKYGKLNSLFGTNDQAVPDLNYDRNVLLTEGLIHKPYYARIAGGDRAANSSIQLIAGSGNGVGRGTYFLDGTNNVTANAQFVVQAVIQNVAIQDAKDLNDRIDGTALGARDLTSQDNLGRVEYLPPTNNTTTVYIYLMQH
jgi:type II secretory pathway pseudopilin PulG